MDIQEIKNALNDSDPQQRMRGVRELRNYDTDVATPLLLEHTKDGEFLVRSFVAMGLGKKKSPEAFNALLEMIKSDGDPNVRSEAANSLSYYDSALPHLVKMYRDDDHWLVRRSIIAAVADSDAPQELLEICTIGLSGNDEPVKFSCINCLGMFANTEQQRSALDILLSLVDDESWRIRSQTAKALGKYKTERAIVALNKLKSDEHHRVVASALDSLV